jgi:quercetin dioxygenase-like cupin family protein
MTADESPVLTATDEAETLWFNGALVTIRVPGAWSGEAFSLAEVLMPKGRATGLHTDPSDETFHVVEGELLFHIDGEDRSAGPNETVAIRRGVPHAFLAVSDVARLLVLNTPGTHDRFFRAGGFPATDRDFANAPPPDHERTLAAAREVGVELLGPPPFPKGTVRLMSG